MPRSRRFLPGPGLLAASLALLLGLAIAASQLQAAAPAAPSQTAAPAVPQAKGAEVHWLVTLALTEKFDRSRPPLQQEGFPQHVAHVRKLADEGTLAVGGPLLEDFTTGKPIGAIYIVVATSADDARRIVDADPIVTHGLAKIDSTRAFVPGAGKWLSGSAKKEAKEP
jgi:uncharacterized protein YciI